MKNKSVKEGGLSDTREAYFATRVRIGLQGGGRVSELKKLRKEIARLLTGQRGLKAR